MSSGKSKTILLIYIWWYLPFLDFPFKKKLSVRKTPSMELKFYLYCWDWKSVAEQKRIPGVVQSFSMKLNNLWNASQFHQKVPFMSPKLIYDLQSVKYIFPVSSWHHYEFYWVLKNTIQHIQIYIVSLWKSSESQGSHFWIRVFRKKSGNWAVLSKSHIFSFLVRFCRNSVVDISFFLS